MQLQAGQMTSGRRTPAGNAAVGGVPGSWHMSGDAVDYWGPDLGALKQEVASLYPGAKILVHDGHVHAQKRGINAPYFGKRGTQGLR